MAVDLGADSQGDGQAQGVRDHAVGWLATHEGTGNLLHGFAEGLMFLPEVMGNDGEVALQLIQEAQEHSGG